MQQAQLGNVGRETGDVAHILAVALADDDAVERQQGRLLRESGS